LQNPYEIGSDEQGYFFTTDLNVTYRIVFDDLDQIFNQYPTLQGRVFSYSFYPLTDFTGKVKADLRIKQTIAYSISNFFTKNDNLIVFVCDSSDRREMCRKKLFDRWFGEFNAEDVLEKYAGSVQSEDYRITNAIIMKADLTDKDFVIKTFEMLNDEFTRAK
jgi:hypothetical protein